MKTREEREVMHQAAHLHSGRVSRRPWGVITYCSCGLAFYRETGNPDKDVEAADFAWYVHSVAAYPPVVPDKESATAIQVTLDKEPDDVARWCGGEVISYTGGAIAIRVPIPDPQCLPRYELARVGDWIIRDQRGIHVVHPDA